MCAALGAALLLTAAAPAWADVAVTDDGRTALIDCDGGAVSVSGHGNRLVFRGDCASLSVDGADNVVEIDIPSDGSIRVGGTGNHVLFAPVHPAPAMQIEGPGNVVESGALGPASAALAPDLPAAPPDPASIPPPETAAGKKAAQ
jgi:hypothetical protein